MAISDGKLLFFHGVVEGSVEKKNPTREYKNRTVYDCFNNPSPDDFGIPALNIPPNYIGNRPHLDKRAHYTPDLLPDAIFVAFEKCVSTLTTPSDSPQLLVLTFYVPNHLRAMKKYEPYHRRG